MVEPTGKLFKYVSAKRLAGILETERIRFTQPNAFNDPFEMPAFRAAEVRSATPSLLAELSSATIAPLQQGAEILAKAMSDPFSVTKTATQLPIDPFGIPSALLGATPPERDDVDLDKELEMMRAEVVKRLGELQDEYGILSLTSNPRNLLMWAHYADHHRGAVVAIDIEHPDFSFSDEAVSGIEERREVTYQKERPALDPSKRVTLDQLFTKDRCWEDEREYRIVRNLKQSKPFEENISDGTKLYMYSLPNSCLESIIFGCRFFENSIDILKKVKKTVEPLSGIPFLQADMDPSSFKLKFSEIMGEQIGVEKPGFELARSPQQSWIANSSTVMPTTSTANGTILPDSQ